MTKKDYQKNLVKSRTATNVSQNDSIKRISSSLETAYRDLTNLMNLSGPESVSYSVYAEKRAGIERILKRMISEYNLNTQRTIFQNAASITDLYIGLNSRYSKTAGFSYDWKNSFNTVPMDALRNVMNRVWGDGLTFSGRLWNLEEHAVSGVTDILEAGISRGESAVNMSKELQQFLLEPAVTDSISWTSGVAKSVTGRGTLNFNALRLAVTEINNSYREALVISNARNPIMLGTKWNLSNAHVKPDICDIWATIDRYNLGAGVSPAGMSPIDHPWGKCFVTEVMRNPAEWDMPKETYSPVALSDKEITAPLGDDVSEAYKIAALNMFESTNKLISKPRYKAAA